VTTVTAAAQELGAVARIGDLGAADRQEAGTFLEARPGGRALRVEVGDFEARPGNLGAKAEIGAPGEIAGEGRGGVRQTRCDNRGGQ
jgi:hypothetical protein